MAGEADVMVRAPETAHGRRADDYHWLDVSDIDACTELLRTGSHSFFAASRLLPKNVRDPAAALYAFCRVADDAVDLDASPARSLERLDQRLTRIYAGRPDDTLADRGLCTVARQFAIPRTLPQALLEGFAWDVSGRRYRTLSELYDYAARVAGTVGVMMAMLMSVQKRDVLARACDLGVAMQLTNIARDVGEDARAGRLYLPLDRLHAHGVDPDAWLAEPAFNAAIGAVVAELLEAADRLYARAMPGIAQLPLSCRPGIFAARYVYAEIGRELERNGLDSVNHRAVVPRSRKIELLASAVMTTLRPRRRDRSPALKEVEFLVEAAASVEHFPY